MSIVRGSLVWLFASSRRRPMLAWSLACCTLKPYCLRDKELGFVLTHGLKHRASWYVSKLACGHHRTFVLLVGLLYQVLPLTRVEPRATAMQVFDHLASLSIDLRYRGTTPTTTSLAECYASLRPRYDGDRRQVQFKKNGDL
jgi:hypothetical protein